MTVKQLKKQLAAAIAMVVVSVVALSSSTYAWFVSNNSVTADGLTVQATSEAGILIRHKTAGNSGDFASSATGLFSTAKTLYPTSTVSGTTWFHASAQKMDASIAAQGTMKTLSLNVTDGVAKDGDSKAYYIVDKFELYTTGTASNLKISDIKVANANTHFDKSLRVLVVCGTNKYVFAPNRTEAETTYTVGINPDGSTNAGTSVTAYGSDATSGYSSKVLAETVSSSADTPTEVTVYVYFEGEDKEHYSNQFANSTLAVTLKFEATVSGT